MVYKKWVLIVLASTLVLFGCDSGSDAKNSEVQTGGPNETSSAAEGVSGDISLVLKPAELDWVGQKIFQNEYGLFPLSTPVCPFI